MTWAIPAIALTLLAFAAVAGRTSGTPITPPMVFTVAGVLAGATAFDVIDVDAASEVVKLLAEVTLALVLFSDASRIDLRALRRELDLPVRLLAIGLPLTIAAGFGAALLVLGDLDWAEALLLAVVLAPTDAALGQAVVTFPRLPTRVRQALNVESGLNDGICVPIFLLVLAIARAESGTLGDGAAVELVAEQIGYGALAGVGAGIVGGGALLLARRFEALDEAWAQVAPIAAAALAYTVATPLGGSGFIAAFVGGVVFGLARREAGGEVAFVGEAIGGLFAAITFIVFGAVLLGPELGHLDLPILVYAVLSLTAVRLVPVAIALVGTGAHRPTVGFLGWFGPRGLASIVFALMIIEEAGELPHENVVVTTAVATIALSVLAHGLSAAPLAVRYAGWAERHPHAPGAQRAAVAAGEGPVP